MKLLPLLLIFNATAHADDLFELAEKYKQKNNQVVNLESQRRQILGEIYGIEKETHKMVTQKAELDEKKVQLDNDLRRVSARVVGIEKELAELAPQLNDRIAFFDQVDRLPWFYALLTSQSIHEIDQVHQSAQALNQAQANQLGNFVKLHEQLQSEKNQLTTTAQDIVKVKREISQNEGKIELNQTSKSKMLKDLEKKIDQEKTYLRSLKGRGKKVAAQSPEFRDLELLFGTQFFDKKAELPHPIQGEIVQSFGLNRDLSNDAIDLMHKGYFYNGVPNQEVQAVAEGRVSFVAQVPGYGWTIVVDHGGRYYTVYGNLKKVLVKNQSIVKSKQKIGSIGYEHLQYNVGLYFEIRHFSEPQNPEGWLVPQESHLATL